MGNCSSHNAISTNIFFTFLKLSNPLDRLLADKSSLEHNVLSTLVIMVRVGRYRYMNTLYLGDVSDSHRLVPFQKMSPVSDATFEYI